MGSLSDTAIKLREFDSAHSFVEEYISRTIILRDEPRHVHAVMKLAELQESDEQLALALQSYQKSLAIVWPLGINRWVSMRLAFIARVCAKSGCEQEALRLLSATYAHMLSFYGSIEVPNEYPIAQIISALPVM